MTVMSRKSLVFTSAMFLLLCVPPLARGQKLSSDGTSILGVVEPLEMTGTPKPPGELTEVETRVGEAVPKDERDPEELRRSKKAMDDLVEQYPDSPQPLSMRVLLSCEIKSKDVPVSISDIDRVIKLQKGTEAKSQLVKEPELLAIKAKIEFDSGNHKGAVDELYSAILADIKDADNLLNAGGIEPENKSEPCAWYKPDLDQLAKEYPMDYRVYLYRGLYYLVFQRFTKANQYTEQPVADFQHAGTLNQKSPLPPFFLGKFYMSSFAVMFGTDANAAEHRTKATAAYDRAIQIDPRFTDAYAQRAELRYEAKQWREAIEDYDRVIEADPKADGAYNDRALAKSELNDSYSAISDFDEAIRDMDSGAPGASQTYENRADEYMKVQDYPSAIRDYTQAIKMLIGDEIFLMNITQIKRLYPEYRNVPDDVLCRKLQTMFFPNMKFEDFRRQLTEVNQKDFDTFLIPDVLIKRADAYLKMGELRKGTADYQRAAHGFDYGRTTVERWHVVPGGSQVLSIDSETAELEDPSTARFWVKLADDRPASKGAYEIEQYGVDCQLKKINLLSYLKYDAAGTVLSSDENETGWHSTVVVAT